MVIFIRVCIVTPCVGVWIETMVDAMNFMGSLVTPCVGVWIETALSSPKAIRILSHPAWVCGLKHCSKEKTFHELGVTPCVGVWIETVAKWLNDDVLNVTPCVGVWIETPSTTWRRYLHMVTPCVGVYGLKHCSLVGQVYGRIVSIRPLVYFSSSCYKVKSQTKYVRLLTLLWLEKTRTIPDAYLLSVFFCGFT